MRVLGIVLAAALTLPPARVGVELPLAGDDGARGLAALTAIRLGLGSARVVARDSANGGFLNPHRDEGSDNDVDLRTAPAIVASFAADAGIVAAIGGLRRNVGDADAAAARARGLPLIVLSRWSPNRSRDGGTFCLCISPPRLVTLARDIARRRFGPRLMLAFVGEAGTLPALWPNRFGDLARVPVEGTARSVVAAHRAALRADGVIVIADERPPTLWRGATFRERFDVEYVRRLAHRDFQSVPDGAPRGSVVALVEPLPAGERRAFVARYHASAGFEPGAEAAAAHAAAQILSGAGSSRAAVRRALQDRGFDTVIGRVSFDADGYRAEAVLAAAP